MDNSVHSCKKETEPSAEVKTTVKSPNTVLEECIVFAETFKDKDAAQFDALARIYISGRMRR